MSASSQVYTVDELANTGIRTIDHDELEDIEENIHGDTDELMELEDSF